MSAIIANQIVSMYGLYHVETYVFQRWHVYVTYLIVTWICCCIVLFANRALPAVNQLGLFFILAGVFITIIVCAAMPGKGGRSGHATVSFVWKDWVNSTGYSSDGFVFLMGMLNGAYAVGTPDCVSHLAEEIPNPRVNIPKVTSVLIMKLPLLTYRIGHCSTNGNRPLHSILLPHRYILRHLRLRLSPRKSIFIPSGGTLPPSYRIEKRFSGSFDSHFSPNSVYSDRLLHYLRPYALDPRARRRHSVPTFYWQDQFNLAEPVQRYPHLRHHHHDSRSYLRG